MIKNDGTESIIISDNNQKTENGEVDTDVNEATEKESWKLDENGNLIKTVTADVTTITYTDANSLLPNSIRQRQREMLQLLQRKRI